MRIATLCLLAVACPHGAIDRSAPTPAAGRGGGGDGSDAGDADRCATEADCAFTRVPEGGCCPTLCAPRVVTRTRAEALEANIPRCTASGNCPQPLCRLPPHEVVLACIQNRCASRPAPPPN